MSDKDKIRITQKELDANKWFEIGVKSGSKNTVICINEQLELLRNYKPIRTKKQVIDFMQQFASGLVRRSGEP